MPFDGIAFDLPPRPDPAPDPFLTFAQVAAAVGLAALVTLYATQIALAEWGNGW